MKIWNNPSLEELDVNMTASSPTGNTEDDGLYMGDFVGRWDDPDFNPNPDELS